jgi:hypothetical protein
MIFAFTGITSKGNALEAKEEQVRGKATQIFTVECILLHGHDAGVYCCLEVLGMTLNNSGAKLRIVARSGSSLWTQLAIRPDTSCSIEGKGAEAMSMQKQHP